MRFTPKQARELLESPEIDHYLGPVKDTFIYDRKSHPWNFNTSRRRACMEQKAYSDFHCRHRIWSLERCNIHFGKLYNLLTPRH